MVRIPVAEPTVQTQIADMPNLAGDGWGAPGRATQQLGKSIASLGDAFGSLDDAANKENDFNDKMAMLKFSNAVDLDEIQTQQSYNGDGAGYALDRSSYYQDKSSSLMSSISPRNQQRAALFVETKRGPVLEGASRFEGERRQGAMIGTIEEAIGGEFGKLAVADPETFDAQFDTARRGVDAIIDSAPLPENAKEALRAKAAALAESTIVNAGRDDPKAALRALPRAERLIEQYGSEGQAEPGAEGVRGGTGAPGAEGVQGQPGSPSGPAAVKPQASNAPSFSQPVNAAIDTAAASAGVDPNLMRVFARIESSGNPKVTTGSYKGLFQLSNAEFAKHGGTGDIYDPVANANAAAAKFKAESAQFAQKHGRQPAAADLYLIHQQGEAGAAAHWANPDAPAWQSMASTGEGRQKGAAWAKKAIWGNVPADVRAKFGSVENVTSRDFVALWSDKIAKFGGGGAVASNQPQQAAKLSSTQMARLENVKPELVDRLGQLQASFGQELPVNSGFRDKGHNAKVGGAKGSQHVHGNAVDLNVRNLSKEQRLDLIKQASEHGFTGVGVYDNAIHLDMGNRRAWGPDHSSASVPSWAKGVIAEHVSGRPSPPVAERGITQVAGYSKLGAQDAGPPSGVRATNTIPGAPTNDNVQGAQPVRVADASGGTVPQAVLPQAPPAARGKTSVGSHLRDNLIKKLPAYRKQYDALVGKMVEDVEKAAGEGYTLPDDLMAETIGAVRTAGTPEMAQRLSRAMTGAAFTRQLQQMPAAAVTAVAAEMRTRMLTDGATPVMIAQAEAAEKLAGTINKELDKNAITWGVRVGIIPEVEPITLETLSPEVLSQRAIAANMVAQHYGRPAQFFTPDERDTLKAALSKGGGDTIKMLGMMNGTLGGDMLKAMSELSKDAPEAATLGWMISTKADPQAIKDIATGLALRQTDKFESIAPSADAARAAAVGAYGTAFMAMPQAEQRAIDMANVLYDVRARQKGVLNKKDFENNGDLWKRGLNEVLGQNVDPRTKVTYGGLADQRASSWFGGSNNVLVPTNVRSDALPELVEALRVTDLVQGGMPDGAPEMGAMEMSAEDAEAVGNAASAALQARQADISALTPVITRGAPLDERGRLLGLSGLRAANLVSIGEGRYWLALDDPTGDDPQWVESSDPAQEHYVLDLKALEPILRERVPGAYRPE